MCLCNHICMQQSSVNTNLDCPTFNIVKGDPPLSPRITTSGSEAKFYSCHPRPVFRHVSEVNTLFLVCSHMKNTYWVVVASKCEKTSPLRKMWTTRKHHIRSFFLRRPLALWMSTPGLFLLTLAKHVLIVFYICPYLVFNVKAILSEQTEGWRSRLVKLLPLSAAGACVERQW